MRRGIIFLIVLELLCRGGFIYPNKFEGIHHFGRGGDRLETSMVWEIIMGTRSKSYTSMEALDILKEKYAADFIKEVLPGEGEYRYRMQDQEFYLEYEGAEEDDYLFRLYEFVLDEPETGIGHGYTYGWYRVNKKNGDITEYISE